VNIAGLPFVRKANSSRISGMDTKIIEPTEEQIKRAALVLARAAGFDIETKSMSYYAGAGECNAMIFATEEDMLFQFKSQAKQHLMLVLNHDYILDPLKAELKRMEFEFSKEVLKTMTE
jgi:hypothetical protein